MLSSFHHTHYNAVSLQFTLSKYSTLAVALLRLIAPVKRTKQSPVYLLSPRLSLLYSWKNFKAEKQKRLFPHQIIIFLRKSIGINWRWCCTFDMSHTWINVKSCDISFEQVLDYHNYQNSNPWLSVVSQWFLPSCTLRSFFYVFSITECQWMCGAILLKIACMRCRSASARESDANAIVFASLLRHTPDQVFCNEQDPSLIDLNDSIHRREALWD